jgi:hypothetical protein
LNITIEQHYKDLTDGDIAIKILESVTVDQLDAYHLVFAIDHNENIPMQTFYYLQDGINEPGEGLISNPLHTFYIYQTDSEINTKKWIRIGGLSKPDITRLPLSISCHTRQQRYLANAC